MGKPKAPTPPDPAKTAGAQTSSNVATAIANNSLGQINQITPDGRLTYRQTGTTTYTDPNTGQTYNIPKTTAITQLSGAQQRIKNQNDQTSFGLAKLANEQTGRLSGLLSSPLEMNNEAVEGRLMELGRKRLDPMLDRRREGLEARLASQGIGLGTEAYGRAMEGLNNAENDAYNELILAGRGQSLDELLTQRNQPINEISALMAGSPVAQPRFANVGGAQIANTDIAGITMGAHQAAQQNYQTQMGLRQSLLGGLMGAGAAGIMAGG